MYSVSFDESLEKLVEQESDGSGMGFGDVAERDIDWAFSSSQKAHIAAKKLSGKLKKGVKIQRFLKSDTDFKQSWEKAFKNGHAVSGWERQKRLQT
ncbi:MAG: hypothetical protein CMB80_01095 [Flammeovirgaceae bacterium]|nr:hypothetical protein [Flammeovirgaceae bacterium]